MEQPLWIGLIDIFKGLSDGRHISWGILNSIFFASLFILVFYLLKNISPLKHFFGTANLLIPCVACLMLLLIPIETKFQRSVVLAVIMNPIMKFLLDKGIELNGRTLNVWQIILFIWIAGIFISLLIFITKQMRVQNLIRRLPKTPMRIPAAVFRSAGFKGSEQNIYFYLCDGITVPFSTGIARKKSVFLPDRDYTDTQKDFILHHELVHIIHHHHLIALAMEIVRIAVMIFCMTVFFCPFLLPTEINISRDGAEGRIIAVMPAVHIMRTGGKYILFTQDSEKELTIDEAVSLIEDGVPVFDPDEIPLP